MKKVDEEVELITVPVQLFCLKVEAGCGRW